MMRKHTGVSAMALLAASVFAAKAPHRVWAQNGNGALGALAGGVVVVDAQNVRLAQLEATERRPRQAAVAENDFPITAIKVRHVKPSLLLWWINPLDQQEPEEVRRSRELRGGSVGDNIPGLSNSFKPLIAAGAADMTFDEFRRTFRNVIPPYKAPLKPDPTVAGDPIPPGLTGLAAVDATNEIWARGTEEGVQTFRLLVEHLDRPMQQVELTAQIVEGATANIAQLLVKQNAADPARAADRVMPNYQATLKNLIVAHKAKIIDSSRVVTFDNMTASTQNTYAFAFDVAGGQKPGTTAMRCVWTPTINRDGTITIAVQSGLTTKTFTAGQALLREDVQQVSTISNINDGGTLAIARLRLKSVPQGVETERIILVTARIVQRNEAVK